jgi:hypothetical protein
MQALLEGVFRRLLSRPAPLAAPPVADEPEELRGDARRPAEGSALLEWIDQEDCERAQAVHLIDQSTGGLGVRSPVCLDPGWPVLLTLPQGAPLKAVVRHRRRDHTGWVLGLQLIRRERRRFDRRPMDREVELAWQGPDGQRRTASGRLRDVGEGGLQFVCKADIPFRTSVLLAIEGWQRFGTIVHIRPDRDSRSYGVQFSGPPVLQRSVDFED